MKPLGLSLLTWWLMALINDPILEQTFEIIRDRIVSILELEFPNQQILQPAFDLSPEIVKERSVAFDTAKGTMINVMFISDSNASKNQVSTVGDFTYYIDVWTNKKDTDAGSGDEISRIACQRLIAVVRGILEAPVYKNLGFNINPKPVQRVNVNLIQLAEPDSRTDAANISQARIQFEVRSTDINILEGVRDLEAVEVQFKINDTDKGNLFEKDA